MTPPEAFLKDPRLLAVLGNATARTALARMYQTDTSTVELVSRLTVDGLWTLFSQTWRQHYAKAEQQRQAEGAALLSAMGMGSGVVLGQQPHVPTTQQLQPAAQGPAASESLGCMHGGNRSVVRYY